MFLFLSSLVSVLILPVSLNKVPRRVPHGGETAVLSSESSHLIRIIEHVLFLERRVPHGGSEPKLT